ncbi:hypothetical protein HDR63_01850 [bacterium]|nr:hypothetical protein [bacterium]
MAEKPTLTLDQIRDIILRDAVVREKLDALGHAIATAVATHIASGALESVSDVPRADDVPAAAAPAADSPAPAVCAPKPKQSRTPRGPRTYDEYIQMSPATLRQSYYYWGKKGPLPDALKQALKTVFQKNYDAAHDVFCGARTPKRAATPTPADAPRLATPAPAPIGPMGLQQPAPVPLYSNMSKQHLYTLIFQPDALHRKTLLLRSRTPYTLLLWDQRSHLAVVRKTPDDRPAPMLFIVNVKHGLVVNEIGLGTPEIRYAPDTHEIFTAGRASGAMSTWSFGAERVPTKVMSIPAGAQSLHAYNQPRETVIIDVNGHAHSAPLVTLPDSRYAIADAPAPALEPEQGPADAPAAPADPAPAHHTATNPRTLLVTIDPVKMTLDGVYNNVYVNGKLVLKNHINTVATTFLDGTVLGLFGIAADDNKLPKRPLWQIMDGDLRIRTFTKQNTYAATHNYVAEAIPMPGKLRLGLNNNSSVYIDAATALARARGRVFEIATRANTGKDEK